LKKKNKDFKGIGFKPGYKFLHTATFRLTIWYLGVFSLLSIAVFAVVYVFLASHLNENTDREIMDTANEFSTLYREHGVKALESEFIREAASRGTGRVFFELVSLNGKVLAASDLQHWKNINLMCSSVFTPEDFKNIHCFRTLFLPGHRHKTRVVAASAFDGNIIRIGITLRGDELLLERYRETFGTALMIMIVCGGLIGWLMARKAMSGIKRITETAIRIGKHDFGQRVELTGDGEEISALARAFNDMLERIESLMKELHDITDNIAHELRTPITRIRCMAESMLKYTENVDEYMEVAALVIEASDDLIEMIGTMLEIARTDSGAAGFALKPVNIQEIVEEAADLFLPAAEDKQINIIMNLLPEHVVVKADRSKLQRVVANLIDNAIKYTPSGGTISLSVNIAGKNVKIEISDTGKGMEEKDIPRIFDRFYRCDKSRSEPGNGLGLSLALSIVRALGGSISVKNTDPGASFTIVLPLSLNMPKNEK